MHIMTVEELIKKYEKEDPNAPMNSVTAVTYGTMIESLKKSKNQ